MVSTAEVSVQLSLEVKVAGLVVVSRPSVQVEEDDVGVSVWHGLVVFVPVTMGDSVADTFHVGEKVVATPDPDVALRL